MGIPFIIFTSICMLSLSMNIIKDLPPNVNFLEDMDQYQNKYIPEGNKFYIRIPSNLNNEIKFYLTLPKNTTLFPIYSAEFSNYPEDKELVNTEFKNEIELKERADLEYSVYLFDIKKTKPYKVLFFQNNEAINYMSFYASSSINDISNNNTLIDLTLYRRKQMDYIDYETSYYFKVGTNASSDYIIKIETSVHSSYMPDYQLDLKCFSQEPTDEETTKVDNTWIKNMGYQTEINDYDNYEHRYFEHKPGEDFDYCAIHIYNKRSAYYFYIYVDLKYETPAYVTAIIVIVCILFFIGLLCLLRSKTGRAFCAGMIICAACCADMASNS